MGKEEVENELGYPEGSLKLLGYVDWFEVLDRSRLERAIGGLDGIERTSANEWTWHDDSDGERRVVAELELCTEQLALETYTEEDSDRCRSRLERAAGPAVEFQIGQESWAPADA